MPKEESEKLGTCLKELQLHLDHATKSLSLATEPNTYNFYKGKVAGLQLGVDYLEMVLLRKG